MLSSRNHIIRPNRHPHVAPLHNQLTRSMLGLLVPLPVACLLLRAMGSPPVSILRKSYRPAKVALRRRQLAERAATVVMGQELV